ncbi:hypothetical protein BOO71_0008335 [Deinococcus marmoris]|uniref:Uncharacterized protein n=1 Tax=Deinococcus marmoris TaxID=249408 RepID=A0A1U7NXF3_9DEIO|nr:hypothetical protein BOO71_0008335 [Deinococcus marmoris]
MKNTVLLAAYLLKTVRTIDEVASFSPEGHTTGAAPTPAAQNL